MNDVMVSICCITYNQAKFLRETLQSFINQNVNFTYEIVISNDCSTDDTQTIIDSFKSGYPELIKDISPKSNLGMMRNFFYALNSCKGKYIAYCEGDDYWIDENKLQRQVDFLETNQDFGLVYTKVNQFSQKKNKITCFEIGKQTDFMDLLTVENPIPTLTSCFRREIYNNYIEEIKPENRDWNCGDFPLWLYISHYTKIKCMDDITGIYRVLPNSASHFKDPDKQIKDIKGTFDIRLFYSKYFNEKIEMNWDESSYYIPIYFNVGNRKKLVEYDKPISSKENKIIVFMAKFPIVFNIYRNIIRGKRWISRKLDR